MHCKLGTGGGSVQLSLDLLVAKGAPKSAQWVKVDSPQTTFDLPSQNTGKA